MAGWGYRTSTSGAGTARTTVTTMAADTLIPIPDRKQITFENAFVALMGASSAARASIVSNLLAAAAGVEGAKFNSPTNGPVLGTEMLTNGSFTGNITGWTGTNWAHSSDTAQHTPGSTSPLTQNVTTVVNATYLVAFTISDVSAGTVGVSLNGVNFKDSGGSTVFGTTTRTLSVEANSSGSVAFSITPTSDFDGKIVDVSLRRVTAGSPSISVRGSSLLPVADVYTDSVRSTVGIGTESLRMAYGYYNTAVGLQAAAKTVEGGYNAAFGFQALYSNTQGGSNTAIGYQTLFANTHGYYNIAIGQSALAGNTVGYNNVAVGVTAGLACTTGNNNVGVGHAALGQATTAAGNSVLGAHAGYTLTTGGYNVMVGFLAGYGLTTSGSNAFVGSEAGRYLAGFSQATNITNSVIIGAQAKVAADNANNEIVIGAGAQGLGSASVVIGNSSISLTRLQGKVGIGVDAPTAQLQVRRAGEQCRLEYDAANYAALTVASNGNLTIDPTGTVVLAGSNRAALVADASDLASAVTLVNALKATAISHGLMAAA